LSSTSLTFPSQNLGTSSTPQTVTLTNSGNGLLTITNIAASGDFSQTNNCGGSVAVGASCTITIIFTPTTDGLRNGAVIITDNASDSPQTILLFGAGTGTASGGGCSLHASNSLSSPFSLWIIYFIALGILFELRIRHFTKSV